MSKRAKSRCGGTKVKNLKSESEKKEKATISNKQMRTRRLAER